MRTGFRRVVERNRRRDFARLLGLTALFLLGIFVGNLLDREPAPPPVSAPPRASRVAPVIPTPLVASEVELAAPEPTEPDPLVPQDAPVIRRFLALNRHPASSRPLSPDSTDLLNPDMRHERRLPLPGEKAESGWEVLYTADRYAVRGDEPVVISLELWKDGRAVALTSVQFSAQPTGANVPGDDVELDGQRIDGAFRATFTPEDEWPDYLGLFEVTATFSAPGREEETGSLAFYFTSASRIPGHFTGDIDDRLANGNLIVDVGVEVETPGIYRIEGNLYDAHDRPIAWARFQGDLAAGQQDAPLEFHGLIFHDAGATPPFVLHDVRGYRMRLGDSPHREDLKTPQGVWAISDDYILADFDASEHQSSRKERMVNLYQDALERGVRFTRQ